MPRHLTNDPAAPEHDSFLDIVANIVGILIILVMVVGVRAKNAPVVASIPADTHRADTELERELAVEQSLRSDVLQMANQVRAIRQEAIVRHRHRAELAARTAAWQQKIQSHTDQLDSESRENFALERTLSAAQSELQQLRHERDQTQNAKVDPILVECYPTPLSKTVHGHEVHFRLRGQRIMHIPVDELLERFKADARRQAHKLLNAAELTDTVGPIGGFRLRYTLERYDVPLELHLETGRGGSYARLRRWTMIPVRSQLGETVEEALAEGSRFREVLSSLRPGRTTVTIWTYPDSFASFRQLKKELYRLGFPTASRPLPYGVPISGSPHGSRSAAE